MPTAPPTLPAALHNAYVALGSNIDAERNVEEAVRALARACRVTGLSTFYRTSAIGPDGKPSGQADFVNGMVRLETDAGRRGLRRCLRAIESELGRRRSADRYAPRTIDLDLVFWSPSQAHVPAAARAHVPVASPDQVPPDDGRGPPGTTSEAPLPDDSASWADPDIGRRAFLRVPLGELDPHLLLPGTGIRPASMPQDATMQALGDLTRRLRAAAGLGDDHL